MIGTDELKGFTIDQLRTMYAEARGLCIGVGKFDTAEAFNAFALHYIDNGARGKLAIARSYVQFAFGQVGTYFAKNVSIPPSEETLAWGGFLGGEVAWDRTRPEAMIREIMRLAAADR